MNYILDMVLAVTFTASLVSGLALFIIIIPFFKFYKQDSRKIYIETQKTVDELIESKGENYNEHE